MKNFRQVAQKLAADIKATKPQNRFSEDVLTRSINEVRDWLIGEAELSPYNARLLAGELIDRVIHDRAKKTAPSAANVYFSDKDKIEFLVFDAKKLADKLDQNDELEPLLDELVDRDAQGDGNSL